MQNPPSVARRTMPREELIAVGTATLARLRAKSPRVHCITNSVAQNFTANVLLALGAVPSMTLSGEEIGAFVARSDALLVNLGTFDRERREATSIAVDSATRNGLPWVLDPVFVDRAEQRAVYARDLIFLEPKAIRLNAAEFTALAGTAVARAAEPGGPVSDRVLSSQVLSITNPPPPTTISGFFAAPRRLAASRSASSSKVGASGGNGACGVIGPDAHHTSIEHCSAAGPGRPVLIARNASATRPGADCGFGTERA